MGETFSLERVVGFVVVDDAVIELRAVFGSRCHVIIPVGFIVGGCFEEVT